MWRKKRKKERMGKVEIEKKEGEKTRGIDSVSRKGWKRGCGGSGWVWWVGWRWWRGWGRRMRRRCEVEREKWEEGDGVRLSQELDEFHPIHQFSHVSVLLL